MKTSCFASLLAVLLTLAGCGVGEPDLLSQSEQELKKEKKIADCAEAGTVMFERPFAATESGSLLMWPA